MAHILYTTKQAADYLNLSDLTLRKWRWEGKLPKFVKLGGKVLYRKQDLDDFIVQQIRISTSDTGEGDNATY